MLYLRPRSDPLVGKQLGDSGLRMCTDALENVARIKEGIAVESFARGDEAGQDRRRPSAVVAPMEHLAQVRHALVIHFFFDLKRIANPAPAMAAIETAM
jgi:hypothetical protein